MSIKDLTAYIIDGYRHLFNNPETVIGIIAYLVPFILAVVLNSNKMLWLLLLSPALEGIAVYLFHYLYNV